MKKSPKNKYKRNKIPRLLFWTPRILSILFILFISMFALDIFEGDYGFWGTIIGLFMHLIPSFIMIILLVIAWKWEKIGGWAFVILAVLFTLHFRAYNSISSFMLISFPVLLIGILFILEGVMKRKR
jgi:hypothetical protein